MDELIAARVEIEALNFRVKQQSALIEKQAGELKKLRECAEDPTSINRGIRARDSKIAELKDTITRLEAKLRGENIQTRKIPLCFYCQVAAGATRDHFIARSRGGSEHRHNLVPACSRCNEDKSNRLPTDEEWERFTSTFPTRLRVNLYRQTAPLTSRDLRVSPSPSARLACKMRWPD